MQNTGNIHFVYDATGRKWAKSAYAKASADETAYAKASADETAYATASADENGPEGLRWYVDNAEFLDGKIQHVAFPDGRFVAEYDENGIFQNEYRAEYFRTDHLGNTRLTFSDFNHDMVISPQIASGTPTAYDSEITSENHYYPFGLGHTGPWYASIAPENKYRYNGKEWNEDWGLNMYDYGARGYMPDLGRWGGVDALAELMASFSTYSYSFNNPIVFRDPTGLIPYRYNWDKNRYEDKEGNEVEWSTVKGYIEQNNAGATGMAILIGFPEDSPKIPSDQKVAKWFERTFGDDDERVQGAGHAGIVIVDGETGYLSTL